MNLPVLEALPELMNALHTRRGAVLQAPPGAGKSTGIPPALLDAAWLGGRKIVMLEPRRLAARAVAARMASVRGERLGETIGYRTRLEAQVSRATRIEVITEGILTRRLQNDPTLEGVGLVIFDEFHERNLEGDLALALCLDAQASVREDLRMLVMSATLDGAAVARLLDDAPLVTSAGRSYEVETRYTPKSRRADERLEAEVVRAVRAAHQSETGDLLVFLPGSGEIRRVADLLAQSPLATHTRVLPLYGDLSTEAQDAAIRPAPGGERKVVLATNIAETSVTIEGIRVVIDSGLERRNRFDPSSGMNRLELVRSSRASADQRRGRAGRLEPGVCIRLWTEGEQASLAAQTSAEILESDLAPLALELAEWGIQDPCALRWLDPPPPAPFAQARDLLTRLRALDSSGRITVDGRSMAALGTHPRLAHMLVRARALDTAALACELAGVLSERDLLRPRGRERNADLEARVETLRSGRSPLPDFDLDAGARNRAARQRDLLRRRLDLKEGGNPMDLSALGALVAFAYPDRIARKRDDAGRYLLANGRGAQFQHPQPLSQSPMLAIADLAGGEREARIYLAARLAAPDFDRLFADEIEVREEIVWNSRELAVVARKIRAFGSLTLDDRPLTTGSSERLVAAMIAGIRELGLSALPWTKDLRIWRARVEFVRRALPERSADWPALDDAALFGTLETWLAPFLDGITRREHLARVELSHALHALFTWKQREDLERFVPTHILVPSGSRIPIEFDAADSPSISVRLQELFGLTETPSIAEGRIPITLKMLSPAGRPVQVTQDLRSFWARGYHEVRKELKGRYPKHHWPDDPLQATPTRRARPRH